MAFCKRCGNNIKEGIKFCSKCGLEINNLQDSNSNKNIASKERLNKNEKINESKISSKNLKNIEDSDNNSDIKNTKSSNRNTKSLNKDETLNNIENTQQNKSQENIGNSKQDNIVENIDDIKIIENKNNLQGNNKSLNKNEKNKSKKGLIVGLIAVVVIAGGSGLAYAMFKDDIAYEKYMNEIKSTSSVKEKFECYDKIIKLEKYDKVKEEILELVESDRSNFVYIDDMTNLSKDKKNELKRESLEVLANEKYKDSQYKQAKELLMQASNYGYDLANSVLYKNIQEQYNTKDDNYSSEFSGSNSLNYDFNDEDKYLISDSDVRYLNQYELSEYSKEELALIRNEIYARHGYVFNQEPFKTYFNEKEWYKPDSKFKGSDSELNDMEKENIQLLLKIEKAKG